MDFHLDNFDGPLDLLLHLISKNKVSIYDIPIAEILEQYMAVLHEAEHMDLDVAGDFIAMAAQLVYIKSNTDEIKTEQREQRKTNTAVEGRLAAVEASAKSAHHRIDHLEAVRDEEH